METKSKEIKGFFIPNTKEGIGCAKEHIYNLDIFKGRICIIDGLISAIIVHKKENVFDESNPLIRMLSNAIGKEEFTTCPMIKSKDNPNLYISADGLLAFSNRIDVLIDHLANTILGSEDYFKVQYRRERLYSLAIKDMTAGIIKENYYYDNKHIYFYGEDYIDFISIDHLNECALDNPLDRVCHFYNSLDMMANYMLSVYESLKDEFESYSLSNSRKTFKEVKEGDIIYILNTEIEDTNVMAVHVEEINKNKNKLIFETDEVSFEIGKNKLNHEVIFAQDEDEDNEEMIIFTTKESFLEYRLSQWRVNIIISFARLGVDLSKLHY